MRQKVCPRRPRQRHLISVTAATLLSAFVLGPSTALAQQQQGRSFKLGESDVTPEVRIDYISNSNAFLDAQDEVETTGVIVAPQVEWRADRRLLSIRGGYEGSYGSFSEDALNHDDHFVYFSVASALSTRSRLGFDLSIANRHEELGTDDTRGRGDEFDEPSESTTFSVATDYTFGAESARGNLTAGLLVENTTFSEFLANQSVVFEDGVEVDRVVNLNQGDDFTLVRPSGIFSLRLSPDTRLLAELRYAVLDFDQDTRDRDELSLLFGAAFQGTGKLGGSAKVGGTLASFKEDGIDDQTELTADVNVFFLPRTYSRFSLTFSRKFDDQNSGGEGAADLRDAGSFSWRHDWSTRFNSIARLALTNLDRDCFNDQLTTTAGIELNVVPRRWIEVGVNASTSERRGTSNNCIDETLLEDELDFERHVLGAHFRISL